MWIEKSYREISSVLSISEPAVRMKFMRLKKDIKKKLSRHNAKDAF